MTLNLRRPITKKSKINLETLLKDENLKRLTPTLIEELERLVPLRQGNALFNKIGWDSFETRSELFELIKNKKISLKIAQMEIGRRKKMKHV